MAAGTGDSTEAAATAAAVTGPAEASTAVAEGVTGTTEEATAGAVEAAVTTKGLAEAEAAAEGAAPARAAARRMGPAAAAAATRGRRRQVRGEDAELAAARPSTPPSGGQRPRPRIRRRRVRRDPLVIASPDLLARIVQLVPLVYFWCREYFKVLLRDTLFSFFERFCFLHRGRW